MFTHWFRSLLPRSSRPSSSPRRRIGLAVEVLESRLSPAVVAISPTTTRVLPLSGPYALGTTIPLQAQVTADITGYPTGGDVTFFLNGQPVGDATVNVLGLAQLNLEATAMPGTYQVTAQYDGYPGNPFTAAQNVGDASSVDSTGVSLTEVPANTTTTVSPSANPVAAGQPVTFTASLSFNFPNAVVTPTGSFTFALAPVGGGTVTAVSVPLQFGATTATYTVNGLLPGSYQASAVYNGDSIFAGSTSNTLTEEVTRASTTTTLAVSPATVGQPLTLTATVGGQVTINGQPVPFQGSVAFNDGTTQLGVVNVNGNQAVFTLPSVTAGTHHFSAVYSGDAATMDSSSGDTAVTVQTATSHTVLAVSPSPAGAGQPVTLTATVSGQLLIGGQPVAPAGSVTFSLNGQPQAPVTLVNGQASLTLSLPAGGYQIDASYSGDGNYSTSAAATVTETVTAPPLAVTPNVTLPLADLVSVFATTVSRHGKKLFELFLVNNSGVDGFIRLVLFGVNPKHFSTGLLYAGAPALDVWVPAGVPLRLEVPAHPGDQINPVVVPLS
jgi:hypothetical protein